MRRKTEVKDNPRGFGQGDYKDDIPVFSDGENFRRSRSRNEEQKLPWEHVKSETCIRHPRGAVK